MEKYSDYFLDALGAWQQGWREDASLRGDIAGNLKEAISREKHLPDSVFKVDSTCYRRRYISNINTENCGDMLPLFRDGEVVEGIASWSTDYNYVKNIFKKGHRAGWIASVFYIEPNEEPNVILNICALWQEKSFRNAVADYEDRAGKYARSLVNFGSSQSEIILDAPLKLINVKAFCGEVPSLEDLCAKANISTEEDEEGIWKKMCEENLVPTEEYWIEDESALNAIGRVQDKFLE